MALVIELLILCAIARPHAVTRPQFLANCVKPTNYNTTTTTLIIIIIKVIIISE
jgi:hypothetical protein